MILHPITKETRRYSFFAKMKIGNVDPKAGQTRLEGYDTTFINMVFCVISEYKQNNTVECVRVIDSVGSIGFQPGLPLWISPDCEIEFYVPVVNPPYSKYDNITNEIRMFRNLPEQIKIIHNQWEYMLKDRCGVWTNQVAAKLMIHVIKDTHPPGEKIDRLL